AWAAGERAPPRAVGASDVRQRVPSASQPGDSPHPAVGRADEPERTMHEVTAQPLRASAIVGTALRTYRERFARVAGTAFVVFGAVAGVDAVAVVLVVDHVSSPTGDALASVAAAVFGTVGVVIYAGILDKVVGSYLHGHPDVDLRHVWRVLPLGRLVLA